MPSSQKGDASMEDQTSQAEEMLAKNTGKTGTPATQPPGKGASKRKGKKPRHKFPGFLQAKAEYTSPCLRKAVRYPNVDRKKPVLYLHPIHKKGCREGSTAEPWATRTGCGNGYMRQKERDVWCG